jgi:hypothetical protein
MWAVLDVLTIAGFKESNQPAAVIGWLMRVVKQL